MILVDKIQMKKILKKKILMKKILMKKIKYRKRTLKKQREAEYKKLLCNANFKWSNQFFYI